LHERMSSVSLIRIMYWLMGSTILFGMGVLLRRLLGLGGSNSHNRGSIPLSDEMSSALIEIAQEVENQSKGIAVRLDEAIAELGAGRFSNTSNLLELAAWEWLRLAELLTVILRTITEYLPMAAITVPVRSLAPGYFRSDVMIDHLRIHQMVDQFLFRTKLRYHLQVRVLRQAVELLTADFERLKAKGCLGTGSPEAFASHLDRDYHDFDLTAKRTVLALGKMLRWLPETASAGILSALRPALHCSELSRVRSETRVGS